MRSYLCLKAGASRTIRCMGGPHSYMSNKFYYKNLYIAVIKASKHIERTKLLLHLDEVL